MKRVYIIHPFQGKEENRKKIDKICRAVAKMGFLPVSPVHAFGFLKDEVPEERELALKLCQELVKGCDQAWRFGDWEKSEGCNIEIRVAKRAGIPIVDFGIVIANFDEIKELVTMCGLITLVVVCDGLCGDGDIWLGY